MSRKKNGYGNFYGENINVNQHIYVSPNNPIYIVNTPNIDSYYLRILGRYKKVEKFEFIYWIVILILILFSILSMSIGSKFDIELFKEVSLISFLFSMFLVYMFEEIQRQNRLELLEELNKTLPQFIIYYPQDERVIELENIYKKIKRKVGIK